MSNTIDGVEYQDNFTPLMQHVENCPYRLPCGLCKELNQPCPQLSTKITWEANNETAQRD